MQEYDLAAFWGRFPKSIMAICKLDLEHGICLPTPATEPEKAIYNTYRQLVYLEAILKSRGRHESLSSDDLEDLSFRCYDVTD